MYAHTHIHIYTYISQHVDPPNINALCMGGGTRCSGRVSVSNGFYLMTYRLPLEWQWWGQEIF